MIGKLNHVAIVVPDLEAATSRYRDTLGAQVSAPVDLPDHGVTTVFVELPNTKLELLHPLGEDSPIAGFLAKRGPGVHHLAFKVGDCGEQIRVLTDAGAPLLDDAPRPGAHGCKVAFVHPKFLGGVLAEPVGAATGEVDLLATALMEHHLERRLRAVAVLDQTQY